MNQGTIWKLPAREAGERTTSELCKDERGYVIGNRVVEYDDGCAARFFEVVGRVGVTQIVACHELGIEGIKQLAAFRIEDFNTKLQPVEGVAA